METAKILQAFGFRAPCTACTRLTGGHVHATWRLDTAGGSLILQEVRHEDPAALMEHTARLSAHLRGRQRFRIPQYYCTAEGPLYEGRFRLMDCIPGEPVSADAPPEQIEAAGLAFGCFDAALCGLEGLPEVYPGLHDTRAYLRRLHSLTLPEQYAGLLHAVQLLEKDACRLWEQQTQGLLPLRTVHGDTKGSNVLLDGANAAVIDLDTAGKGLIAYDHGDGIRSLAQHGGVLDPERFRAFTKGFLRGMRYLTDEEIASLVPGICCITTELAVRYLIDLAEGCSYFGKTPEQTAERVRELLSFASAITEHENELQSEVQSLCSRE